ncbi:MAG: hypothetical protein LUG49_05055 [Oscillospiraceae bacterium]|nr:hypothetical protein [Oscillospiraceae bacterium]
MKKILAVVTALALAISSLCVFVFATESDNIISSSTMYSGYYNDYTMGSDGASFSATSGGSQIGLTLGTTVGDGESITLKVTGTTDGEFRMWLLSGGSRVSSVYLASDQEGYTTSGTFEFKVTMTVDGGDSGGTSGNAVMFKGPAGGNLPNLTVTSVTIVTEDEEEEEEETVTIDGIEYTVVAEETIGATLTGSGTTYLAYTWGDDTAADAVNAAVSEALAVDGAVVQLLVSCDTDYSWYGVAVMDRTNYNSTGVQANAMNGTTEIVVSVADLLTAGGLSADCTLYRIYVQGSSNVTLNSVRVLTPVAEEGDGDDDEDDGTYYSFEEDMTATYDESKASYDVDPDSGIAYIDINEADAEVVFTLPSDVDVATLQSITIEDADSSVIDDLVIVVYADGVEVASATGSLTVDVSSVDLSSATSVTFAIKSTSATASYCFYGITLVNSEPAETTNSAYRFIYVNDEYHALIIERQVGATTRRFLISIPHNDDNHDGYCDTCKEYVGGEDEDTVETVTIGDVEYEVVYSNEDGISAGNWNQVDLGDLDLIEALSQDGAILVITRDTETVVSFADGGYEKFLLIDSWWSNGQSPISLGTAGHTSADEDVIDCTSDDGITAVYDGSAIYAAWEDGGYAEGGSTLVFISNTSASYKITSIQVLVPVE